MKKENLVGGIISPNFNTDYGTIIVKTGWYCWRVNTNQWQRSESRNKPAQIGLFFFDKMLKNSNRGSIVILTNDIGTVGDSYTKLPWINSILY